METWKIIPGFEYEVSDLGRVRSLTRSFIDKMGRLRKFRGKILKPVKSSTGYRIVTIHKNGKQYWKHIHELVLTAFTGDRPIGQQSRHLNDVRADNRLENLCWGTAKENCVDRKKNDPGWQRGSRNGGAKLNEKKVRQMRRLRARGVKNKYIAKRFGVTEGTASEAINGRLWSHV